MLGELLNTNVFSFLLIFARVGSAMMLLPGFSASYVSARIKTAVAVTISFVLLPLLGPLLPPMPASVGDIFLLVLAEILVGSFFGLLGKIMTSSLQTAGTLIALHSSLANALLQDPVVEQQSSTIASLLSSIGLLLVFVTDLHHLMLSAVFQSYTLFVPGKPLIMGDFSEVVARTVASAFAIGLQMTLPFILTAVIYYAGLGVLSRLMPQLQVFFVGMPIQIMTQIAVLGIALSAIMMVFLTYFAEGFGAFVY